ncbi:acylneuraminate cytidylyltransferase family protein [Aequorivita flava]|uniref:Acylneuraminate cytidylyltransferase family protein n=1 Tax=Aequorivita flava TaxID=3114371 RepID=A0AB35YRC0_9FLAO
MKFLGIIPARGGSKGIPNKNRKMLLEKPLMQYTIESALASKLLSRVIFSSEDEQLIALAQKLGVEVPFKRPEKYSRDNSPSIDFVKHALKTLSLDNEYYDAVCLLQVTSPFRGEQFIDQAISKFVKSETDSLISVIEVPHEYNPHWVFKTNDNGHLVSAVGDREIIKRRQDLPPAFIRDGAIYITKTEVVLKHNSLFGDSISYIQSNQETYVNIDTTEDWENAEKIAKNLFR